LGSTGPRLQGSAGAGAIHALRQHSRLLRLGKAGSHAADRPPSSATVSNSRCFLLALKNADKGPLSAEADIRDALVRLEPVYDFPPSLFSVHSPPEKSNGGLMSPQGPNQKTLPLFEAECSFAATVVRLGRDDVTSADR